MFNRKKKEPSQEEYERIMQMCDNYEKWKKYPTMEKNPFVRKMSDDEIRKEKIWREKNERRMDKIDNFFTTLRDIILTPLAPIFSLLSSAAKIAIYVGAISFLYGCFRIYKNVSADTTLTLITGIAGQWKLLVFPFIASGLHFVFENISEYCSVHSIY